ncbi:hypothetical protein MMC31_000389 [Peltigera leucophlebia]|nr:hypothetical protein [Peltigera leucophlebia]
MPAPAPTSPEVYNSLISLLSPSTPQVFELDILPSYFPAEIHSTSSAIALPKPLLASLFLTARHVFFSYLNKSPSKKEKQQLALSGTLTSAPADAADDALQATKIILLWDPNHLTAANFRKRNLLSFSLSSSNLVQHLKAELSFLSSLLTSPLPKHTKSSTLWSHRFFLFQKFGPEISAGLVAATTTLPDRASSVGGSPKTTSIKNSNNNDNDDERTSTASDKSLHLLWLHELEIIMKAGDRHPKNYYAWSYARQLLTAFSAGDILPFPNTSITTTAAAAQIRRQQIDATRMNRIAAASILPMQKWCLAHPRDISGWAFLEYLLTTGLGWEREGRAEERKKVGLEERGKERLGNGNGVGEEVDEMVRKVVKESEEFMHKFQWQGDSLAWFLKAMGAIDRESKER